jgi:hypothetical protein
MKCGENLNPLYPGNFGLVIESDKFEHVEYFCQQAAIPTLSFTPDSPMYKNYEHYVAGDTIRYSPFNIQFVVDEDMQNYLEMFNWFKRIQDGDDINNEIHDGVLLIYTNKGKLNKSVRFKGLMPQIMGELMFSTQESDSPITCNVDFAYTGFEFE